MPEIFYEDIETGEVHEFGDYEVTKDEITEFAGKYDPQPFHVDEEQARESMFGELVASGWHTSAMSMRMVVDNLLSRTASLGSPGVDELRWVKPVRPGDTLSMRVEMLEKRVSEKRPGMGVVKWRWETLNQDGDVVMTLRATGFVGRRDD
ncbi:MAG: MaoC family dehydratase [Halobacteria archaeon]|nr:MaoC family dehydratase [Halobacteria archaeon]